MTWACNASRIRSRATNSFDGSQENSKSVQGTSTITCNGWAWHLRITSRTMQMNTRKNYVCDQMQAALIYISEYAETKRMMTENIYPNEDLLVRLRAVFGCVDRIQDQIDKALQQDDAHQRRHDMRSCYCPKDFPALRLGDKETLQSGWTGYVKKQTWCWIN